MTSRACISGSTCGATASPDRLDALERAFDGGSKSRERATMLQDLFLKLDKEAYATVNQRILAALTARPALDQDFVRGPTLSRLGELGPPAVPHPRALFFPARPAGCRRDAWAV